MATITYTPTLVGSAIPLSVGSTRNPLVYEERIVDFATAATIKGSALAAADVIEAIPVPPNSVVLAGGYEFISTLTGTISVGTVSVGITGTGAAIFLSGYDIFANQTLGNVPPMNTAAYPMIVGSAGDTVDLLLASLTGTLTGGSIRMWALIGDFLDQRTPGITARKS